MDKLAQLCPDCGHVLMWSTGKLKKRIFAKWRKRMAKVKYWYCAVGEGSDWTVPFCNCRNPAHNLWKE